jgi:hypothetical protein
MAAPAELEPVQVPAPRSPEAAPAAAPVSPEHGFTPKRVIALQKTAGNQAVTRLIDGAHGASTDMAGCAMGAMFGTGGGMAAAGAVGAIEAAASAAAAGSAVGAVEGAADAAAGGAAGAAAGGAAGEAAGGAAGAAANGAAGAAAGGAAGAIEGAAGEAAGGAAGAIEGAAGAAAGGAAGAIEGAAGAAGGGAAGAAEGAAGAAAASGSSAAGGAAGAAGGAAAASGSSAAGAAGGGAAGAAGGAGAAGAAGAAAAGAGGGSGLAPTGPGAAPDRSSSAAAAAGEAAAGAAGAAGGGGGGGGGASGHDPHQDPSFQAMKGRAGAAAGHEKAHQPSAHAAAAAQGAAAGPANEVASQAAGAQVDTMGAQQPGAFDKAAFVAAVKKAVDAASPQNLEEANDFKDSGKAKQVKGQVSGLVKGGKEGAQQAIKGATDAAPDRSKATPKDVTPMPPQQPGPAPPDVSAASAMPSARPAEETDLSSGPKEVDAQMADAGVTDEQLQKSNEPDFTGALKARDEAKAHSDTAPAGYRREEEQVLGKSQEEAAGVAATGMAGMRQSKIAALAKAMGHQGAAKSADEGKRAKVAADIEAIYEKTKTDVNTILTDLDGKVDTAFTQGEEAARKQFETFVGEKMDAYKDDRYSGWRGKLRWAKDKLFGMPSAVNAFYDQGKAGYLKAMDVVIGNVADLVGAELTAARQRIAKGRADVHTYVEQLPRDLHQVGQDAEGKLDSQFDQLSSDVDNKSDAMVDALAQKYVAAQQSLDSRIEELKAANRGLVDKALDAVVGVVKTILKLKDMLLSVLAKAASVIGDIIADPIGFLGNLVDGVKSGVVKFKDNIAKHLEKGLMDWLFGALGEAGITLPEKLDLAGIFDLVMQVLGLTYANIRARVAKLVGEENVARMEQTVDVFKSLAAKGLAGLWEWIKDKLGNFEDMVLGAIKDFVIERVVKAGITWIISLLNPASAFIKACKAIYDIVMWIVERGAQIMEFVNSILDSVGAIAKGNLGAVASKVEDSLAKALPVAISFLASLLGLGGISEKIKGIIDTVRAPINKAVDFVVGGAVKTFKKMFGGAMGWAKGKVAAGKAWVKGKVEAGKAFVKGKVQGVKDRLTGGGKTKKESEAEHVVMAEEAAHELSATGAGDADYATQRARTEAKAHELERRFTPRLEPGIGMRVKFKSPEEDAADNGLDFEVVIAPNTTKVPGKVPVAGKPEGGAVPWDHAVVARLRALGLDDGAIGRVFAKAKGKPSDADHIKGQLLEELNNVRQAGASAAAPAPPAGEPKPEYIPGHEVEIPGSDVTDGIRAILGSEGDEPVVQVLKIYEAKAGKNALRKLGAERDRFSRISEDNKAALRQEVIQDLIEEKFPEPEDVAKDPVASAKHNAKYRPQVEAQFADEITRRMKPKYEASEAGGQAARDFERVLPDVDKETGADIPAQLKIRGVWHKVVRTSPRSTSVVAVLPKDLSQGEIPEKVAGHGIRMEVERSDLTQAQINGIARDIAAAASAAAAKPAGG